MAGTTTSFPGMPGPAGPAGPAGPEGPQGAIGPQGPQGIQGETGPAGAQGPQGSQGAQGDPGATGATGAQGTQGPQGVQGPQGDPGAAGADGDRYQTTSSTSLTIATGTQTLTVETGLDYSVTQSTTIAYDITRHMHGEVVSYDEGTGVLVVDVTTISGSGTFSAWAVNLSGAVGAVGPAGPEGPQGPQGVQGEQGVQGIQGVQGATGPQGDTGPAGAQGIQGDTGPAGPQGPEGPQGPAGAAGTTTVVGLTDRYEELPAQTFSDFAHGSLVAASPTRDIQTAIDATPVGPACQVIVGPGSYAGATVTIPTGRNNIAIIGPSAGDFGGTIASLSSGRALTVGNNAVRVRLVSLQIEGLTTISTTGAGVHRIEQCQLVGGLTIGAISAYIYVVGCEVGAVTINAGFTGTILFDRCVFTAGYTNNTQNYLKVLISDSAGLATAPTLAVSTNAALLNGRFQTSTGTVVYRDGNAISGAPVTALSGLTPAADRIAYYTSGLTAFNTATAAMTALTTFGRSLIDDADAATARTTLGLGTAATSAATAFQAADATLTALAGVTTAANKLPYFTGVDTAAVADITTAGREILSTASSGTNGQVLTSSGGGAPTWTTVSGGGGGGAIDVQAYSADGTWTKPAGAQFVEVIAIGGGGGGGSGRLGAAASTRGGGAGGGGAGITRWMVPAAALGATVAVTVGQGGVGGAPQLTSGVNGNAGSPGTASTFGAHVYASGGFGGAGGAGTSAPIGGAGASASIIPGGVGGNGGAGATGSPTVGASALGAAGGGGGGSVTSGNTQQAGANGGAGSPFFAGASALAGGAGGATGGTAGAVGTSTSSSQPFGGGGGGGGGANHAAAGSAPGGDGGDGGSFGAGGGGGGGGTTSTAAGQSGEGGAGANGIVYVITY